MYRIQVRVGGRWRWGINDYTFAQARRRVEELNDAGISARIKPLAELLG